MTGLRVRWATGPDDRPANGEALARLLEGGPPTVEKYPGAGVGGSDLVVRTVHTLLSVETADGRRLVTSFRDGNATPWVDDLREAWREAWRERSVGGRPIYDPASDVMRYEVEVDRRIRKREPTELEPVAGLMGWVPRTVVRHIQRVGFADWPDFVATRRAVADSEDRT